jgi:hypothetical protein
MTIQACNPLTWPWWVLGSAPALNTLTFDATTDRLAAIFQCPKAGDLDRAEPNIAAITTWPTGGVQVGWQGVTETAAPAIPNGTYTHSVTVTVSPGAGWWSPGSFVDGGAAKRTVTRGELIAFVMTPVSGTTNFTVNRLDDAATAPNTMVGQFPAFCTNTSGSYAATPDAPCLALFYDGESNPVYLHPTILPIVSLGTKTISNANPDYGGLIFQVPYACKISGAYLRIDPDEITSILLITDNAAAPLATATWDKDRRVTSASGATYITFDTEVTLSINTNYRIVCVNTGSATACGIAYVTLPSAAYRSAMPLGITANWTQSDDGTTWAETTTEVPLIQPVFSGFDDATGGGGGNTYSRGRVVNV